MKLAWVIALVLMLIGFAILFRPPRIDETMAPTIEPKAPRIASTTAPVEDITSVDAPVRSAERTVPAVAPASAGPRTHVTGRCVDERGGGLTDVELTLDSVGERWSASVSAPFVLVDGRPQLRFRARSSADGRFTFDVPSPDATSIQLLAIPGLERLSLTRALEHVIGHEDVDLGDLCFASAGRIAGHVRTSAGDPVEGVLVRAQLGQVFVESKSDASGRFLLGHLVAGRWLMHAQSWCYVVASEPSVDVVTGRDPVVFDFVADRAPVLEGRVIDTKDQPVAGAKVAACRPREHDLLSDTTATSIDGTFELCLRSHLAGPLVLHAQHPGFVQSDEARTFDPGTRGIVLVMKPSPRMTFRVLDARTGSPIESYRIDLVVPHSAGSIQFWVQEEEHARGEAQLALDDDDLLVLVDAPDHARLQARVAADDPGGTMQTLRMAAGASISGRATIAGQPVADIDVHAAIARPPIEQTDLSDPAALRESAKKRRYLPPDDWPGRDRNVITAADGRFRFGELAAGSWIVSVKGIGVASRSLAPLDVRDGASFDLGDIRLDAGAGIEGRLLLPKGVDPRYVRVTLDGRAMEVNADEHGAFRFEGLEAGRHRVEVPLDRRLGLGGTWEDVELAADERRHLDLDLRDSILTRVHVRVTRDGRPLAGADLFVSTGSKHFSESRARVDDEGNAELAAPVHQICRIEVVNARWIVAHSAEVTFEEGRVGNVEIAVDPGRLEIVLPERIRVQGTMQIFLDVGFHPQSFTAVSNRAWRELALDWSSHRVDIGEIEPGVHDVMVLQRDDATKTDVFRFEGSVSVEAGRTGVADFSDR